jgi:hypothetical protein
MTTSYEWSAVDFFLDWIAVASLQWETGLSCVESFYYTEWSKSHATHIQIFIDGWNSIQFDWVNKHNIAATLQEPTQVTSCCNLLASDSQLSSNSRSARMSFSQVQRVFIVEHYLASRSYETCQNEFRDTFPNSPVSNKSTISRLVNRFRDTGSVQNRNRSGWPSVLWDDSSDDIRQTLLCSGHSKT